MTDFQISKQWQMPITVIIALLIVAAMAFSVRTIRSAAATPTPTEVAAVTTPRARPTIPPTFTVTPSPTVAASPTATFTPSPTATRTPTPAPTPIVVKVTELGYLTTVEYKSQTVVAISRENGNLFQNLLGNDRVLLVAVGNVQAGIDMAAIPQKDVRISGSRIRLTIPRATVNTVEMLPGESTVIDSEKKWLFSDYVGLETEAMDLARNQLQDWAENEAGILPVADRLAKLQLTEFLQKLGFTSVTITFTDEVK